jgi:hypothetical protein
MGADVPNTTVLVVGDQDIRYLAGHARSSKHRDEGLRQQIGMVLSFQPTVRLKYISRRSAEEGLVCRKCSIAPLIDKISFELAAKSFTPLWLSLSIRAFIARLNHPGFTGDHLV